MSMHEIGPATTDDILWGATLKDAFMRLDGDDGPWVDWRTHGSDPHSVERGAAKVYSPPESPFCLTEVLRIAGLLEE